ncbi:MAG TPA: hypothetical protein VKD90_24925 [Gemmataceae bacterium]|nr:hypothetical protein [Gemmataceae bacterium]
MPTAHCPRCSSPAHFGAEVEGKVVVCPQCRTAFVLVPGPEPKTAPAEALPELEVVADGPQASPGPPPLPRSRRPGRRRRWSGRVMDEDHRAGTSSRRVWLALGIGAATLMLFVCCCGGEWTARQMKLIAPRTSDMEADVQAAMQEYYRQQGTGTVVYRVHLTPTRGGHYTGYAVTNHGQVGVEASWDGRQMRWGMTGREW